MPIMDLRLAKVEKVSEKKWKNKIESYDTENLLRDFDKSENK